MSLLFIYLGWFSYLEIISLTKLCNNSIGSPMTKFTWLRWGLINKTDYYLKIRCIYIYIYILTSSLVWALWHDWAVTTCVGHSRWSYRLTFILAISTALMRPRRPKRYCLQLYIYIYIYIQQELQQELRSIWRLSTRFLTSMEPHVNSLVLRQEVIFQRQDVANNFSLFWLVIRCGRNGANIGMFIVKFVFLSLAKDELRRASAWNFVIRSLFLVEILRL